MGETRTDEPLRSEFANDSDMLELVELFVEEMVDRIASLERHWVEAEFEDLRTIAHQLKGAGGGYGFPTITDAAGKLEKELKAGCTEKAQLESLFEDLVSLCKRASA